MGRKLSFDKARALEQAGNLFHKQGYAATSIRQCADAMGIPLASLYHSFGDKDALFLSSLTHGIEHYLLRQITQAGETGNIGGALRELLLAPQPAARFLLISLLETKKVQPDLYEACDALTRSVKDTLETVIIKGQTQGTVSSRLGAHDLAEGLLNCLLTGTLPTASRVFMEDMLSRFLPSAGAGDFRTLVRVKV